MNIGLVVLLLAVVGGFVLTNPGAFRGPNMPQSSKPFKWFVLRDIWSDDAVQRLFRVMEERGKTGFVTAAEDFTAAAEDIGESQPLTATGGCSHRFLTPNANHTRCILPSRIDVGRHFLTTGGTMARKEPYEQMVPRLLPFISFFFDQLDSDDMKVLFQSEQYKKWGTEVCEGQGVFDPIQLSIIMALPGQEVAMHYDVPWFKGATRFSLPQWLLTVMAQSGLYNDRRINQVQGVAYLRKTLVPARDKGGFLFFPNGTQEGVVIVPAQFNTAIIVDGSEVVHATESYKPDSAPPIYDKSAKNELKFLGDGKWAVFSNGVKLRDYTIDDLRVSLVWRSRCFATEADKKAWHNQQHMLTVAEVLDTLWADLIKRGRVSSTTTRPAPLDLALLLLDEYVYYPSYFAVKPWIPLNYCMLKKRFPGYLDWIMDRIC